MRSKPRANNRPITTHNITTRNTNMHTVRPQGMKGVSNNVPSNIGQAHITIKNRNSGAGHKPVTSPHRASSRPRHRARQRPAPGIARK